jgi:hypothetical protein
MISLHKRTLLRDQPLVRRNITAEVRFTGVFEIAIASHMIPDFARFVKGHKVFK